MGEAVAVAKDEIYEILADSVEKLELVGNDEINNRTMTTLENALNRMKLLCNFNQELGSIADSFGVILTTAKNADNREKMFNLIDHLRSKLSNEINLVTTNVENGKGHKKLAQWML